MNHVYLQLKNWRVNRHGPVSLEYLNHDAKHLFADRHLGRTIVASALHKRPLKRPRRTSSMYFRSLQFNLRRHSSQARGRKVFEQRNQMADPSPLNVRLYRKKVMMSNGESSCVFRHHPRDGPCPHFFVSIKGNDTRRRQRYEPSSMASSETCRHPAWWLLDGKNRRTQGIVASLFASNNHADWLLDEAGVILGSSSDPFDPYARGRESFPAR
jgi:hypothetical protein